MPIPLNEHVIVTIGPVLGGSGGTTPPEPPEPPEPPTDFLPDTFWTGQNYRWEASPYMWIFEGHTTSSLLADGKGANVDWQVGFRPNFMTITVNSDIDRGGFGFLFNQDIILRDTADAIIASINFDFDTYDQDLTFKLPITFGALDIGRLQIESFLYNDGPLITALVFTDD